MKKNFVRRVLVGFFALTTMFSSVGTAVFAADGEAVVAEMTDEEASVEASVFVPVTTESEESANEEVASEASLEISVENEDQENIDQDNEAQGDEVQEIEGLEVEGLETESLEIEGLEIEETDSFDEDLLTEEALLTTKAVANEAQTTVPDLSDPNFAKVNNILPGSVTNVNEEIVYGFEFTIPDASKIPDGKFKYTLPNGLDFSAAAGSVIPVLEGTTQIGTAVVGQDKVVYFSVDPKNVEDKPNGLSGSVKISCKLDTNTSGNETSTVIVFSNGQELTVLISVPTITVTKNPVDIKDGKARFSVVFKVSGDVKNFEATDILGSNLELVGTPTFHDTDYKKYGSVTVENSQKIVVKANELKAGTYTLSYEIRAIADFDTSGMSEVEKKASINNNKVIWNFEGANEHELYSYANQYKVDSLIRKTGNNGSNPGKISADGTTDWTVYINRGSYAYDLSGYKFVDELDSRMVFIEDSFEARISSDGKTWIDCQELKAAISINSENNKFEINFNKNIPVGFYRIRYKSKIKDKLPIKPTTYYNWAKIYNSTETDAIETVRASNRYEYSGDFTSGISKEIYKERTSDGIVEWKTEFTVDGEKNSYTVTINDTIAPDSKSTSLSKEDFGAYIYNSKDITLVKVGDDGETPITGFTVTESKDNKSFTLAANKLKSGTYRIYYQTQDYYGDRSNHVFPSGITITMVNNASIQIDEDKKDADPVSYTISENGIPMLKEAVLGSFDSNNQEYLIPWNITVNKNDLGQSAALVKGSKAKVTDLLPEGLEYVLGSAVIKKAGEENGVSLEPTVNSDGSKETLIWEFDWDSEYYVISFKTKVTDKYLMDTISKGGNGSISFAFMNEAQAQVGYASGMTQAASSDTITLLDKKGILDEKTGLAEYTIIVNKEGIDLFEDKEEVELTDTLTNGKYLDGSLKVYDLSKYDENAEDNSAAIYTVDADKITSASDGKSFTIKLPDDKAFVVKYQVIPDASMGVEDKNGAIEVTIDNKASLVGKGVITSGHKETYTIKNVHADITSNKGMIKITKVSTGNNLVGLKGAEFKLVRIDVSTGTESEIARSSSDDNGVVTFERDGNFDSLIFDTLYYYQETAAPSGYKLDDTKHYIVFKGNKYDERIGDIKNYLGGTAFVEYDTSTSVTGQTYEDTVENEAITNTPDGPDDPVVITVTTTTTTVGNTTVTLLDLPEVLGAYRDDLPEVLGARRANTNDSDMSGAYAGMIIAFIALGYVLTKKNKDIKL